MSPTSVCYAVAKVEPCGGDDSSGLGMKGSGQLGIRKQEKLGSGVKVSKDSHRIRKPPLPLPQVQYRPPIIIHTYSPKVIHTQPHDFMSLVQKLTGSSDTRLRLKRNPAANSSKPAAPDKADARLPDPEQPGSKTVAQCGSPSSNSSEEDSSFLATSEVCVATNSSKQSQSPRSPLANFEFDNQVDFPFTSPFDSSAGLFSSHVKAEPSSFSFNDTSFNFFTDFGSSQPAMKQAMKQPKVRQEYSPFHSIDINNSSGLMAGLPDLSPASASWSQSFLDSYLTGSSTTPFTTQPPIQRQRFTSSSSSSEGTMVALENIQAFMLT